MVLMVPGDAIETPELRSEERRGEGGGEGEGCLWWIGGRDGLMMERRTRRLSYETPRVACYGE